MVVSFGIRPPNCLIGMLINWHVPKDQKPALKHKQLEGCWFDTSMNQTFWERVIGMHCCGI